MSRGMRHASSTSPRPVGKELLPVGEENVERVPKKSDHHGANERERERERDGWRKEIHKSALLLGISYLVALCEDTKSACVALDAA